MSLALALLLGRILVAVVFAFAGGAKMARRLESGQAIAAFGVPALFVRPVTFLLPAAELGIAVLLLPSRSAWWGATGALALLLVFIVAIATNLLKGRTPDCQCFGQVHAQPIGRGTLVRNALLALCAAPTVWAGQAYASLSAVGWFPVAVQARPVAVLLSFGALLTLALQTFLILHLFRQHGRVLVRMDHLEQRLATGEGASRGQPAMPQGLAIGTPAPSFKLPTLSGTTLGLEALLRGYRAVLLIFSNPSCQPCTSLWPEIKRWQRDASETVRIAVVSGGSAQANIAMTEQYALEDVLLQKEREVAELYAVQGTPGAVLIRADGTVGSLVAMGGAAIASLLSTAMASFVVGVGQEKPTPSA